MGFGAVWALEIEPLYEHRRINMGITMAHWTGWSNKFLSLYNLGLQPMSFKALHVFPYHDVVQKFSLPIPSLLASLYNLY